MNPVAWFLSMFYPLCGTAGAEGIAPPGIVDFSRLQLMGHSEYLVAPASFTPAPGTAAPVYHLPPAQLFGALRDVGALQPRTYPLDVEPQALQAAWVTRSAIGNFPDIIEAEILPEPGGNSSLIFYSHAVYGASDYGVNRQHAMRWLQDLNMKAAE